MGNFFIYLVYVDIYAENYLQSAVQKNLKRYMHNEKRRNMFA